mmetsp:Transcript_3579/g.10005  ORF Transcript_3579/g.10005 Transcript_3579/m.10005 type:complete len:247 (+) Transcript_3579:809-1549(+)
MCGPSAACCVRCALAGRCSRAPTRSTSCTSPCARLGSCLMTRWLGCERTHTWRAWWCQRRRRSARSRHATRCCLPTCSRCSTRAYVWSRRAACRLWRWHRCRILTTCTTTWRAHRCRPSAMRRTRQQSTTTRCWRRRCTRAPRRSSTRAPPLQRCGERPPLRPPHPAPGMGTPQAARSGVCTSATTSPPRRRRTAAASVSAAVASQPSPCAAPMRWRRCPTANGPRCATLRAGLADGPWARRSTAA